MWLGEVVRFLDQVIKPVSQVFHRFSGVALVAMMLITAADVILRNLVNKPIIGSFDLVEFMMAVMISTGLAYVAIIKGNISADVILVRLPRGTQAVINVVTSFLSFVFVLLVAWQTFAEMKSSSELGLTSGVLLTPIFPFIAITAFCIVLLAVVLLRDFFESILEVKK
jgi:TRAP-type transport system small permease protein